MIQMPLSPFGKIKMPALLETKHIALPIEKIREIYNLPDKTQYQKGSNRYNFSRDMFILSFMLIGMNESDLYNCTDYANGRITYCCTKVKNRRKDKGKISIKVEPECVPLLEKYRDKTGKRVFCFYQMYKTENTFCNAINGNSHNNAGLKRIGAELGIPKLKFYAARHSWATIAQNKCGIDKYTVHTALNHVIEEMKVTDIYTENDFSVINAANKKVKP